jgi:cytochrome c553
MMESQKLGMGIGEKVPPKMMAIKKEFEREHGIRLPLGPGNVVTCTSCHNPHQEGVVIGDSPFAGPQNSARLLVDSPWTLCQACHGSSERPGPSPEN